MNKERKYVSTILKKFDECGWSVIAAIDIPKENFICEYAGNV